MNLLLISSNFVLTRLDLLFEFLDFVVEHELEFLQLYKISEKPPKKALYLDFSFSIHRYVSPSLELSHHAQ